MERRLQTAGRKKGFARLTKHWLLLFCQQGLLIEIHLFVHISVDREIYHANLILPFEMKGTGRYYEIL